MLNDKGGTLLIGINDGGQPVGLDNQYALVSPPNADGYVKWLNTLFKNNIGHAGANRLHILIGGESTAATSAASTCRSAPAPSGSGTGTAPTSFTNVATTQPEKYQPSKLRTSSQNGSGVN